MSWFRAQGCGKCAPPPEQARCGARAAAACTTAALDSDVAPVAACTVTPRFRPVQDTSEPAPARCAGPFQRAATRYDPLLPVMSCSAARGPGPAGRVSGALLRPPHGAAAPAPRPPGAGPPVGPPARLRRPARRVGGLGPEPGVVERGPHPGKRLAPASRSTCRSPASLRQGRLRWRREFAHAALGLYKINASALR